MSIFALWKSPRGRIFLIALVVVDIAIFAYYVRKWLSPSWETVVTDDGLASVEMPGTPLRNPADVAGGSDGQLILHAKEIEQEFRLAWGLVPELPAGETEGQALARIPVAYMNYLQKNTPHAVELMRHELIKLNGHTGIAIQYRIGPRVMIVRTYCADRRSYAIEATAPEAMIGSPSIKRFFDSFKIRPAAQQ
jgi:hypothetical protein